MSIKTFVIAALVTAGTIGLSDRADAQWRRYSGYNYSTPSYYTTPSYSTYSYSPGVVYSNYTYPSTYSSSGVITSGYTPYYNNSYYGNTYGSSYYNPYGSSYYGTGYMDPYTTGLYNSYYGGYSNLGGNPYGISVGTRGGMIGGRRAWRW
jgi:hypothetical protein